MSENERLRRSWVANAAAWCDAVREHRIESRRLVTDAAVIEAVRAQRPSRVLDLGCGEGWLARELSRHGIAVTGVDASAPLIEAARALGGGEFVVAGYEELARGAFAAATFDLIVANFSLLDDGVEDVLRGIASSLEERGWLVVQTVHPLGVGDSEVDGWRVETFNAFSGDWQEAMPWYYRTEASWMRLFESAGFEVVETREPIHPERNIPTSLLFICRRR